MGERNRRPGLAEEIKRVAEVMRMEEEKSGNVDLRPEWARGRWQLLAETVPNSDNSCQRIWQDSNSVLYLEVKNGGSGSDERLRNRRR